MTKKPKDEIIDEILEIPVPEDDDFYFLKYEITDDELKFRVWLAYEKGYAKALEEDIALYDEAFAWIVNYCDGHISKDKMFDKLTDIRADMELKKKRGSSDGGKMATQGKWVCDTCGEEIEEKHLKHLPWNVLKQGVACWNAKCLGFYKKESDE